jgi:hypothetical protein
MAAVEITISGTLYDKLNRTTQQVVLIGDASLTGLVVGGGPMPGGPGPGGGGAHPEHPIYYPPMPSHPIYNPGGPPGSSPPGYWGGGMGPGVKPQPPFEPKPPDPVEPPVEWKAVWHPTEGWVVVGIVKPEGPTPTPSK